MLFSRTLEDFNEIIMNRAELRKHTAEKMKLMNLVALLKLINWISKKKKDR